MIKIKDIILIILLIIIPQEIIGVKYNPSQTNIENRKDFQNDRFGIFIHWGIYSLFAQGEWYLEEGKINAKEYAKAASAFYPINFDAKKWVSAIKASGAKYICFTTRHHDGFSMFDTKYSKYDIIDATPFKRDILKELSNECEKQGIKLHLYYSHLDWTRNDYYPLGRTGHNTGRTNHGEWKSYYTFMNNQLTELLTKYKGVRAVWFDGVWDKPNFDWKLKEQYELIHKLKPECLIGNNHHLYPIEGEDFQMFERDLPGENKAGLSGQEIGKLPLETCETMNGMWGYKVADQNYKSVKDIVRLLVRTAGKNANLLLNIGPQPNGELPEEALKRLKGIGEWMNIYGESIYSTTSVSDLNLEWGTMTKKGNCIYVHILTDTIPQYIIIPTKQKIKSIKNFDNTEDIPYETINNGIKVYTSNLQSSIDCILKITII